MSTVFTKTAGVVTVVDNGVTVAEYPQKFKLDIDENNNLFFRVTTDVMRSYFGLATLSDVTFDGVAPTTRDELQAAVDKMFYAHPETGGSGGGGGTGNSIIFQQYVQAVAASSTGIVVGAISFGSPMGAQTLKMTMVGHFTGVATATTYTVDFGFAYRSTTFHFNLGILTTTNKTGNFVIDFYAYPDSNSFFLFQGIYFLTNEATGVIKNLLQSGVSKTDIGQSFSFIVTTPAGLSLSACMCHVSIADINLPV